MKSELFNEVNQIQKCLSSDDLKSIRRELGYTSTNIYKNVLKYRHQNYLTQKSRINLYNKGVKR